MFEELIEMFVPGGGWLMVGVVLGTAFGDRLRPLAKTALKTGMALAERAQEAGMEAIERGQDLVAEARYEREEEQATTTRRPRRAARTSTQEA